MILEGIQFLVNTEGEKTAVLIDLEKYGEIWEDFYDLLIAKNRQTEPRESLAEVKEKLLLEDKLDE